MDKRGITRGAGEGAKDYSQRLIDRFPSEANRISSITSLYNYLNYGPNIKDQERKRILKRLSSEITGIKLSSRRTKRE